MQTFFVFFLPQNSEVETFDSKDNAMLNKLIKSLSYFILVVITCVEIEKKHYGEQICDLTLFVTTHLTL